MSTFKVINRIVLIENILCVFRNYTNFKPKAKICVIILILVVICSHFIGSVMFYNVVQPTLPVDIMMVYLVLTYTCFSTTNTLFFIILGIYYSKSFKAYVGCIEDIHKLCQTDTLFKKSIKKLNKRVVVVSLIVGAIMSGIAVNYIVEYVMMYSSYDVITYIESLISDIIIQGRYFVESLMYYVMCELVVSCLQYLNSSVLVVVENVKNKYDEDLSKLKGDLQKWWLVSIRLSDCSDQISSCFGIEIVVMIFASTVYYILLLYSSVSVVMQPGLRTPVSGYSLILFLADYMVVTLIIARSGQRVRYEADKLDSSLALLNSLLKGCPGRKAVDCARAAGALLRRMRAAPLRVRLFSRPVQMTLLTAVLAATADYTIILLQFNHVV